MEIVINIPDIEWAMKKRVIIKADKEIELENN